MTTEKAGEIAVTLTPYEEAGLESISKAVRMAFFNMKKGAPLPSITREEAVKFAVRYAAKTLADLTAGESAPEDLEDNALEMLYADASLLLAERRS